MLRKVWVNIIYLYPDTVLNSENSNRMILHLPTLFLGVRHGSDKSALKALF